ncbi:50S ribosomal protein L24 [bacterium]|nr:50S ribosomal protein L24 [bacterium]
MAKKIQGKVQTKVPKAKVKRGDEVLVIAGKDKGRRGKVVSVDVKESTCIVEGINEYKKHQKPSQKKPQGGIITVAMPLNISNVMVVDKSTNRPTRVGRKEVKGKSLRYAKVSGQLIDSE